MPNRSIKEDIALTSSLEILITAYQKVSVNRMQRSRRQVLAARKFTEELTAVYSTVRASQQQTTAKDLRELFFKKRSPGSSYKKPPLVIMISSHNRLDGGISQVIFQKFSKYVKGRKCDIAITGEIGASLFRQSFPDRQYKFVRLPNREISAKDLLPLVDLTKNYLNVRIFYGKFINFIKQEPAEAKLSDEMTIIEQDPAKVLPKLASFIYEPSLAEVIAFFDTQILSSLLSRTAQEGSLAEHGSRVTAMELARQNVDSLLEKLSREALSSKKEQKNKRQREQFASLQLWQTN